MTALPGYDAWKLAGPDDGPRSRFAPDTVETGCCIDLAEGLIEAEGTYNADTGELLSIRIAGRDVPATAIAAFVGPVEWARIEVLDSAALHDLCAEALQDAADEYADCRYERWRDDRGL
jgi:hypothetical protein